MLAYFWFANLSAAFMKSSSMDKVWLWFATGREEIDDNDGKTPILAGFI